MPENNKKTVTVGEAVREAVRRLVLAGVDTPEFDAKELCGFALKCSRAELALAAEQALPFAAWARLESLLDMRVAGKPVAKIVGARGFWKGEFEVDENVLEPRPDSETLIEAVVRDFAGAGAGAVSPKRILDLGTGSGCLLISLLGEFAGAFGVGADISKVALSVAKRNAAKNKVVARARFTLLDWRDEGAVRGFVDGAIYKVDAADGADVNLGKFDVVVANPPYIPLAEIEGLAVEVRRWDPLLALAGGADGLSAYREIAAVLDLVLAEGGAFYTEIGKGQEVEVAQIFARAGFAELASYKDLGGVVRVLKFGKTIS